MKKKKCVYLEFAFFYTSIAIFLYTFSYITIIIIDNIITMTIHAVLEFLKRINEMRREIHNCDNYIHERINLILILLSIYHVE